MLLEMLKLNQTAFDLCTEQLKKVEAFKQELFRVVECNGHLFLITALNDSISAPMEIKVTAMNAAFNQIQISEKSDPSLLVEYGTLLKNITQGNIPDKSVELTDSCIKVLSNRHLDIEEVA